MSYNTASTQLAPGQGGPKPLTKKEKDEWDNDLKRMEAERTALREEYSRTTEAREAELKKHKAIAAENRVKATEIKESSAQRLGEQTREHEAARQADAARNAEFVKRINSNKDKINALEREVARLRKAAAYASMEALPVFLARLGLEAHLPALQEEELDVGLLRSMGRDELASNMASLGLSAADATRMADDLFPPAAVS